VVLTQKTLPGDRLGIDQTAVHQNGNVSEQILYVAPDTGFDSRVELAETGLQACLSATGVRHSVCISSSRRQTFTIRNPASAVTRMAACMNASPIKSSKSSEVITNSMPVATSRSSFANGQGYSLGKVI
jgi:hypothetical protein